MELLDGPGEPELLDGPGEPELLDGPGEPELLGGLESLELLDELESLELLEKLESLKLPDELLLPDGVARLELLSDLEPLEPLNELELGVLAELLELLARLESSKENAPPSKSRALKAVILNAGGRLRFARFTFATRAVLLRFLLWALGSDVTINALLALPLGAVFFRFCGIRLE